MRLDNYISKDIFRNDALDDLVIASGNTVNISKSNVLEEDSTVFACVELISSTIASMGVTLYEVKQDGKEKSKDDLSYLVKKRPNEYMTAFKFFQELIKNMLIYKDGLAYIRTKGGRITSIEILDPDITSIEKIYGTNKYLIRTTIDNKQVVLNYNQVIHIQDIADRFEVIKPIIEAKKYAMNLITNYFKDGKTPVKGVINVQGSLGTEAKKIFKRAFNNVLQSDNDGVAILDEGASYSNIATSKTFTEQQLNQLQEALDEDVFKAFKVPRSLVGDNSNGNAYNSLQSLQESFVKSLACYLEQLEQELDYKCLAENERVNKYFKFNASKAMRMNPKDRAEYYKAMVNNGLMSIKEIRELEDLNYIDGTEDLLRSLNYVPLSIANDYQLSKANTNTSTTEGTYNDLIKQEVKDNE